MWEDNRLEEALLKIVYMFWQQVSFNDGFVSYKWADFHLRH